MIGVIMLVDDNTMMYTEIREEWGSRTVVKKCRVTMVVWR
jgi:hypothetical protein